MKKRILAVVLMALMALFVLGGCSETEKLSSEKAAENGDYQYVSASDTINAAKDGKTHILDVREWSNYVKGRVGNSQYSPIFPLDDESLVDSMKVYADKNLKDGEKIYIICNSGQKGAQKATGVLKEAGISEELIYTVEGGAKALAEEKNALITNRADENIDWKYIKASELLKMKDAQIVDVRDDETYAGGHLANSFQVGLKDFENPDAQTAMYKLATEKLNKEKPVYFLCYSGNKCAKTAISVLKDAGFDKDNLFIIENGAKDSDIVAAFTTEKQEAEISNAKAAFEGKYIVDVDYLKKSIGKENTVIIDARGEDAAKKGTIKGAIATTWQQIATCGDGKPGDENWGCVLDTVRLSERLGKLGLDKDKEIILFSNAQDGWGEDGRIAWELIAAGYKNVKMVNGGYDAAVALGAETQKGASKPIECEVKIDSIDQTHVINTDELASKYADYKIVDVRADDEYNGKILYGEAKGGHLPNAVHIRYTDFFNEDCTLKSMEEITKLYIDAGIKKEDKVVTYCTAGIRSAYAQLILEMCGFDNSENYDESYYRWCAVQDVEVNK